MISAGWKIFRIANFIQLIYILFFLGFVLTRLPKVSRHDLLIPISFALGFLIMACNNYFNLFILKNYFPDKMVPPALKKLNTALFAIGLLIGVSLLMIIVMEALKNFKNDENSDNSDEIALAFLASFLILINWLFVLVMQIKMFRVINQKYFQSRNNIINSSGQD